MGRIKLNKAKKKVFNLSLDADVFDKMTEIRDIMHADSMAEAIRRIIVHYHRKLKKKNHG
jgi:hypothetical protein